MYDTCILYTTDMCIYIYLIYCTTDCSALLYFDQFLDRRKENKDKVGYGFWSNGNEHGGE